MHDNLIFSGIPEETLKTPCQRVMKSHNPPSWPVIRNILDLPSLNVNDRGVTIEPKEKWRSPAHLVKHDRDICILCGFSFVSIETIDRKENIYKFYDINIKSSKERIECVRKVTETQFNLDRCITCTAGVCRKCFRSGESILKTEEKNNATKEKNRQSLNQVFRNQILSLSSFRRKSITTTGKRMLRSPDPPGPVSRQAKAFFLQRHNKTRELKGSNFN